VASEPANSSGLLVWSGILPRLAALDVARVCSIFTETGSTYLTTIVSIVEKLEDIRLYRIKLYTIILDADRVVDIKPSTACRVSIAAASCRCTGHKRVIGSVCVGRGLIRDFADYADWSDTGRGGQVPKYRYFGVGNFHGRPSRRRICCQFLSHSRTREHTNIAAVARNAPRQCCVTLVPGCSLGLEQPARASCARPNPALFRGAPLPRSPLKASQRFVVDSFPRITQLAVSKQEY
jgi:hypothetical protein